MTDAADRAARRASHDGAAYEVRPAIRREPRRVDWARVALVVAIAVCGAGFVGLVGAVVIEAARAVTR